MLGTSPEIPHLVFTMSLQGNYYFYITAEERGLGRVSKLPDATQLVNDRALVLNPGLSDSKACVFPIILFIISEICVCYSDMIVKQWCSDEMIEWSEIKIEFSLCGEIWASRKSLKRFLSP